MSFTERRRTVLKCILAAVLCAGAVSAAQAQSDYPNRPIRVVAPFPPGGTVDVLARILGQRLGALHGQNVVVDNKPGASGHVGAEQVARAAPDGYTLMVGTIGIHSAYGIYRKLNYQPASDLQVVMILAELPNVLTVNPGVPAKNVQEFIALAKQRPGQLHYGSGGLGSSIHMVTELFALATDTRLTHVPYKGSGPALNDLMGGQIQFIFENFPTALPLVQAGKLRALGVTGSQREPSLPEVPTVAEAGVPGFAATSWFTVAAPKGVPAPLVERINADLKRALSTPQAAEDFKRQGIRLVGNTPAEAARFVVAETEKWNRVITAAKIQID
jgi:tripartite-type tricarboxylate transporter receptor subunit TctC